MNTPKQLAFSIGSGFLSALVFFILCLNHIDIQEVGIARDSLNGRIFVQREPGWHVTHPFVTVANVSTLPIQVCIFAGHRITNCKLVRFNPTDDAIQELISQQGFHYYGSSRNCNNPDVPCTGLSAIMKGYVFSGEEHAFLQVLREENPVKP